MATKSLARPPVPSDEIEYDTLADPGTWARFVKLLPRSGHAHPVNLLLQTFEYGDCPSYWALSYTWGPAEPDGGADAAGGRNVISVNGKSCTISANLYDFLVELQELAEGGDRRIWEAPIWIDALCINQKNTAERNAQVARMDIIYSSAANVVVWLGRDTPGTAPLVAALLRKMARLYDHLWPDDQAPVRETITMDNFRQLLSRFELPDVTSEDWSKLEHFLRRTWFSRLWIVQEYVLGCSVSVRCGSQWLEMNHIIKASFLLVGGLTTVFAKTRRDSSIDRHFHEFTMRLGRIFQLWQWCKLPFAQLVDDAVFQHFGREISGPLWRRAKMPSVILGLLLRTSMGCVSSEPRDYVYALTGIYGHLSRRSVEVEVNYDESVAELHARVTRQIIEDLDWIGLISVFGVNPDAQSRRPSWALDLTRREPCSSFLNSYQKAYNAAGFHRSADHLGMESLRFPSPSTLCAWGVKVSSVLCPLDDNIDLVVWKDYPEATMEALLQMPDVYALTNERRIDALWKTMLAGGFQDTADEVRQSFNELWLINFLRIFTASAGEELFAPDSAGQQCRFTDAFAAADPTRGLATFASILDNLGDPSMFLSVLASADENMFSKSVSQSMVAGTRLFNTVAHHLGLGRSSVRAGDELWILGRAPIPFILRKIPGQDNRYTIVGDCYVHGIMYGEALTSESDWETLFIE